MGRVSGRLPRVAVLAVLCTVLVVASWLVLPAPSQDATRTAGPAPGEAAGDGSPLPAAERTDRPDRHIRAKPTPSDKPRPSPSTAAAPLTGDALIEATVVKLVNTERRAKGCPEVRVDERLRDASREHSADMARHEQLSHESSDGSSPWQRAERAGYHEAMSENVAMGYRSPRGVMASWMKSQGHRENILDCEAEAVGVGLARAEDGTPYWTQMFGRV